MPPDAMGAVLAGAGLHATWNALVKGGGDKLVDTALVAGGGALVAALLLPVLPPPAPESWPYLLTSGGIHVAYFALVAAAYRQGDLSYAYPVMRGAAPMLVALAGALFLGVVPAPGEWLGIGLISGGVLGLALAHRWAARAKQERGLLGPTAFSLANAGVIAAYTLVDGTGARLSGQPLSYTLWLLALSGVPFLAATAAARGRVLLTALRRRWPLMLIGGACTIGSYALALWAMTKASVASVAALREVSILFGTALAALLLRERVGPARLLAAASIVAGAAVLRLA